MVIPVLAPLVSPLSRNVVAKRRPTPRYKTVRATRRHARVEIEQAEDDHGRRFGGEIRR